jgi:PAS domain S-box-containing protein
MKQAVPQTTDRVVVDAHLSLALEAGQMGTWYWDFDTNQVVWSATLERIFGLDPEKGGFEGTFEAFQSRVHPADRTRVLEAVSLAMAGGPDYFIECRFVRADGAIRWLEGRGRLLRDAEGKAERLIGVCSDITARKEGTLRLQLSEAFYSATIMSVADAVVTTDPEGRVTLMNGVAESLTGWRLVEARGRPFDDVVRIVTDASPIADRLTPGPSVDSSLESASSVPAPRASSAPARRAKLLLRRDGSRIVVDDSAAPIRDAHGEVVGQVVVFRDVTEERQEEARAWFIAEASALLTSPLDVRKTLTAIARFAIQNVADWCAVYAIADDGSIDRIVVTHRQDVKLELVSRLQQYRPSKSFVNEVIRTGKAVLIAELTEGQLRNSAVDEEHFEMLRSIDLTSYMVAPLLAGDRILGAITFVTSGGARLGEHDLHMAEELGRRAGMAMENARLYEEAQRARLAAERSAARAALIQEVTAALSEAPTPSIVAEVVTSLGAKAIGAAAASVFGLTSSGDEIVLVRAFGYTEEVLEGFRRISMSANVPLVEAVKTGRPLFFSKREELDTKYPGLLRPVATFASWAALPLEVEGRRLGAVGISFANARDFDDADADFMVTMSRLCAQALERAKLYQAAQDARTEAEAARRTRENLLAVVSHDLRNPLSAIATTAAVLAKADPAREPPSRIARAAANILRAAQRMDRLIVDLLDLAKIESGRLIIEVRAHDAASLVKESIEILAPVASRKGLVMTVEAPTPELRVFCDRERVLQVLSNLLGNALKFTAEGGSIDVSVRDGDGEAIFAVADTGCGVEEGQLPHIFDRYWQAKSARDGVGLGLSIAKGVIEAHGGRIRVETRLGHGTTFFFTLPKHASGDRGPTESGAVTF